MINDEEIRSIYNAFENICIEIDEIVAALDQMMENKSFSPIHSGLRWGTSAAVGYASYWLPYFTQRLYAKKNENKAIGVQVTLKGQKYSTKIPFISCAYVQSNEVISNGRDEVYWAGGWGQQINVKEYGPLYLSLNVNGNKNINVLNYFIRLTSIKNLESIQDLIVDPLLKMYELDLDDPGLVKKVESVSANFATKVITLSDLQ